MKNIYSIGFNDETLKMRKIQIYIRNTYYVHFILSIRMMFDTHTHTHTHTHKHTHTHICIYNEYIRFI